MKWYKILFAVILSLTALYSQAQLAISPELAVMLQGKTKFHDIMQTVTSYYFQKDYASDKKLTSEFKKWNRWAWYEGRHLDMNGDFVNSNRRNFAAIEQLKQPQQNEANSAPGQTPLSNTGSWSSIGPSDIAGGIGRVDRLAFHPSDVNHLYAGTTGGGLWQSFNGGTNWSSMTGYVPGLGVSGIVVDVFNPNIIYVLSGDGDSYINGGFIYARSSIGILKSVDAGVTWTNIPLPSTAGTYFGFKLIQIPTSTNILMACTSNGLFRSTNSGSTWTKDPTIGTQDVFDIELSPSSNSIVFATTASAIYKSTTSGSSFTLIPGAAYTPAVPGGATEAAISVSANSPNGLYVNFTGINDLYYSSDNGVSFTLKTSSSPVTSRYTNAFTASPANVNTLLIGRVSVFRSSDGGASFPVLGAGVHADFHDLQYNPLDNVLYTGCDGGVYKSTDNGANWTPLLNGMNATQYYHMGGSQGNDGLLLAGAQDNGMHLRNGSSVFSNVGGGDGFDAKFLNSNSNIAFFSINAGVFKYTISPANLLQVLVPGGDINNQFYFYPHLAIHPTDDNIIYAGYGSGVYRNLTGGTGTWTNVGSSGSAGFGAAGGLSVSANFPDRIYSANGGVAQRSDNKGDSWTTISGNPGWLGGTITDIRTRPNNAGEVWVTFGGYGGAKVLYSNDAGANWFNFTGSLPDVPAYCIEYTSNGDAYIGTDAGVFFMAFTMSDWVPFNNFLPLLPVTELYADIGSNSIKAATFGRGIWRSDLYSDCVASLTLSGSPSGSRFYQASGNITSTQNVTGSYGNNVRFRSPTEIVWLPGFNAAAGSYINAVIGPCGQGVLNLTTGDSTVRTAERLTAAAKDLSKFNRAGQ